MPGILFSSIALMDPMLRGLQHESPETKHTKITLATNQFSTLHCTGRLISTKLWQNPIKTKIRNLNNFGTTIDPLHKWRLNLNNNTHTSLAL